MKSFRLTATIGLCVFFVSCGQEGVKDDRLFNRGDDLVADNSVSFDGSLANDGSLLIPNSLHASWDGERLLDNATLKIVAYD
ncbi:MAG: hypothetical protein HRU19_04250 [Pseudobacteriovorax sp.]|nr:hypothetical protein [Pseudobacteriovorax sp.]